MKTWIKILLGIILILIFIYIVVLGVLMIKDSRGCSAFNPENCDYSCEDNSDCKFMACTCVNQDETYSTTRNTFFGQQFISRSCALETCECKNNICNFISDL